MPIKALRFFFSLLFLSSSISWSNTDFLKHEKWQNYVTLITYYHRFYPGVYKALELMALHKIPSTALSTEISKSTREWSELQEKKKGTLADRQKEIQLSRAANERLLLLLQKDINSTIAHKDVINALSAEQRTALTPLDPLFWNSVIGLKAKADLVKLKSDPSLIETVRIQSEKGLLDYQLLNGAGRYRIKVLEKGSDTLRVKGSFSQGREPSSELEKDSSLKVFDLKGAFYQQKEDRLPFGPYPAAKELYLSEDGNSHFKGDGHKHFF